MSDDEDLPTSKLKKSDEPNIDPESGYSKLFKNKMGNRRSHNILLTLVIFLFAVLLLAVLGLSFVYLAAVNQEKKLCTTEDCLRSATLFVESMNKSVDPCEDFYQFACGNYGNIHRIPKTSILNDRFFEIQNTLTALIRDFMEQDDSANEPNSVLKSRLLYRSCMATDEMDEAGLQPLLDLLDKIGLPYLEFTTKNTRKKYSNFSQTIASVHKYVGLEYLFELSVEPNPKNRTVNRISLSKPTGSALLPANKITEQMEKMNSRKMRETIATEEKVENDNDSAEEEETINTKAFGKYVKDVWMEIFKSQSDYSNSVINQFYNRINNMLLFTINLENVTNQVYDTDSDLPLVMTISELQSWTDNITKKTSKMHERLIDWEQYFTGMFADLDNVKLDLKTDLIQIKNVEFFEALFKLLEKYGKSQVLTNVWWEVVSTIIPYTTHRMRIIQDRYYYQTTGLEYNPSRSLYCAYTVNLMMGIAVANVFQNHEPLDRNQQMMVEMLSNIHWAFEQIVKGLKWMDDTTKQRTLYKTQEMKTLIGYPEFISDTETLDEYYSEFVINKTDFFDNVIQFIQLTKCKNLLELRSLNNYTTNMWASDPIDVNAYYLNHANTITIPAGILRFPFFGHDLQVLNYGLLGTILGHELTHGFDNTGRRFNYDGNENMWWTNKTTEEYDKRRECFVNHYESYLIPLINEKVNGKLTLDENIADNGGLREALWAYRKYVTDHGEELKLPGLEEYNNEQIYYLAFANNWCEATTFEGLLNSMSDEHSPNYIRVIGALANSREFSDIWKCEKGTKMNPNIEKCKICRFDHTVSAPRELP